MAKQPKDCSTRLKYYAIFNLNIILLVHGFVFECGSFGNSGGTQTRHDGAGLGARRGTRRTWRQVVIPF